MSCKSLPSIVIALLLCCLPATAGVKVSHDPSVDFSAYRTFEWIEGELVRSPELRDYLIRTVDKKLETAGLQRVESGADLQIAVYVVADTEVVTRGGYLNSVTWAIGVVATDIQAITKGTIILDMVDATSNRAVWQAVAEGSRSDQTYAQLRKKIDRITKKMLRDFPPPYLSSQ